MKNSRPGSYFRLVFPPGIDAVGKNYIFLTAVHVLAHITEPMFPSYSLGRVREIGMLKTSFVRTPVN